MITGTSGSGTGFLLSFSMDVGAAVAVSCFLERVAWVIHSELVF
jgi:hypothetical protein